MTRKVLDGMGSSQLAHRLRELHGSGELAAAIRSTRADLAPETTRRHPNGFAKIAVTTPGLDFRLEVHHWPTAMAANPPHTHRRPFASMVTRGGIILRHFDEQRETDERVISRCHHLGEGNYDVRPEARAGLTPASEMTYAAGQIYVEEPGRFHSVEATGAVTTVVLEGEITESTTRVAVDNKDPMVKADIFDFDQAKKVLDQIADSIADLKCTFDDM